MNILRLALSLCSIALISAHPTTDKYHSTSLHGRKFDGNLMGLSPLNLQRNGISIGFLPALGESVAPNTPKEINAKLPAPMAIVRASSFYSTIHYLYRVEFILIETFSSDQMGDYINLEYDGPDHSQMDSVSNCLFVLNNCVKRFSCNRLSILS
jgi:hypothetical protein